MNRMRALVLWRAPGRDILGTQHAHKNEWPCETPIHGCSESPSWEPVLDGTAVPCQPRVLSEMSAPHNHLLQPGSLEGRTLQLWRERCLPSAFPEPLHFSSFSPFPPHFSGMASQRFLFQAAEHCISLAPLHTWFNFQLAWDAREII